MPLAVFYGALRSGTTIARLMLHRHPALNCPGERDFLLDHIHKIGDRFVLDRQALALDRIFHTTPLRLPETDDGRAAFLDMVRQESSNGGLGIIILHRNLRLLLDIFPDIPIIHLVRDPRDVARSSVDMGWSGNTWYGVDHWIETEKAWDQAAPRLAPGQMLELRYEDLVAAPEDRLTAICQFLGLDYDPAMLSYPETTTYGAPDPNLSYQWRRKQTESEVALVEHKIGPLLTARSYVPSGFDSAGPSASTLFGLWVSNKVRFWQIRFARYGFIDPVLVSLARKLGLKSLARGPQTRINAKERNYLK